MSFIRPKFTLSLHFCLKSSFPHPDLAKKRRDMYQDDTVRRKARDYGVFFTGTHYTLYTITDDTYVDVCSSFSLLLFFSSLLLFSSYLLLFLLNLLSLFSLTSFLSLFFHLNHPPPLSPPTPTLLLDRFSKVPQLGYSL